MKWSRLFPILFSSLLLVHCGGSSETTPTEPEDAGVVDTTPPPQSCVDKAGSCYSVQIVTPSGLVQVYERDLDDRPWVIAFGSSHIAPAVSLAIEDTWDKPYTVVTFNLGFTVGSNDYDVTIEDQGVWDWGTGSVNAPPGFKIYFKDNGKPRTMVSWEDGSSGKYLIPKWGTETGQVIEGKIEGTLVDENSVGKETGLETGSVEGHFRLILPEIKK